MQDVLEKECDFGQGDSLQVKVIPIEEFTWELSAANIPTTWKK